VPSQLHCRKFSFSPQTMLWYLITSGKQISSMYL
jgi:hypothetical protein